MKCVSVRGRVGGMGGRDGWMCGFGGCGVCGRV